jgi:photosystem II stability/assembly factor-like uncharacterized protein
MKRYLPFCGSIACLSVFSGVLLCSYSPQTGPWNNGTIVSGTADKAQLDFDRIFVLGTSVWATEEGGALARSRDEGSTWELLPNHADYGPFLAVFFTTPERGWATALRDDDATPVFLQTVDGGQNWTLVRSLTELGIDGILDFYFADDGKGWAVGTARIARNGVVLSTTDYGQTWTEVARYPGPLNRLAGDSAGKAWAAGRGLILATTGFGKPWQVVYKGSYGAEDFRYLTVVGDTDVFAVGQPWAILHTFNAGKTWQSTGLSSPYHELWLGPIRFIDQKRGWLAGHKGMVFHTEDGGKNWRFETQLNTYYVNDIAVATRRIIAVGDEGGLFWRERPQR